MLYFKEIIINEKEIVRYAFMKEIELFFFEILLKISGIGPKKAMSVIKQMIFANLDTITDERIVSQIWSLKKVNEKLKRLILGQLGKQESPRSKKRKLVIEALIKLGFEELEREDILQQIDYTSPLKEIIQEIIRSNSE